MALEKGSLILIDYTAKVKDNDLTFETTREDEAKKSDMYDPTSADFGGRGMDIKGVG